MDHLIDYASSLTMDPDAFKALLKGIGNDVEKLSEVPEKSFEKVVNGATIGVNEMTNMISGPLQKTFIGLLLLAAILLLLYGGLHLFLYFQQHRQLQHLVQRAAQPSSAQSNEYVEMASLVCSPTPYLHQRATPARSVSFKRIPSRKPQVPTAPPPSPNVATIPLAKPEEDEPEVKIHLVDAQ